jgi:hypothetical protein
MTARTMNLTKQDVLTRAAAQGRAAPGRNRTGKAGGRTNGKVTFL